MNTRKSILLISLFLSMPIGMSGQFPVIKPPQPGTISPGINIGFPDNGNPCIPGNPVPSSTRDNRQMMDMYEQDRLEVQRRNAAIQQELDNSMAHFREVQYELPSREGAKGTEHYYRTANDLLSMLNGTKQPILKEAVFALRNQVVIPDLFRQGARSSRHSEILK